MGGVITCLLGLLMQPWKLMANYGTYIIGWLVGYSGFLGPIAGVMIADYYVVRKKIILTEDLYARHTFYEFTNGFNWKAVGALAAGIVVALAGLVIPSLGGLYHYAWFVGFGVSLWFTSLMRSPAVAITRLSACISLNRGMRVRSLHGRSTLHRQQVSAHAEKFCRGASQMLIREIFECAAGRHSSSRA